MVCKMEYIVCTCMPKWKLSVNTQKQRICFSERGILRRNTKFCYGDNNLERGNICTYLGITFTTGDAFHEAQQAMSGETLKAIFILNMGQDMTKGSLWL